MRICIISKYPPIEGGVSSETYWLAKALGERNHEVFIVTNSWEVEEGYREKISRDESCYLEPKNVYVHSTINDFFPPILKSDYYTEKLINLATDVIRKQGAEVIYSHYLLPYGVVGFITKYITKRPHVVKHAGSDIGRLYKSKFLQTIFVETFKDADKIISAGNILELLNRNGIDTNKVVRIDPSINIDYFNPNAKAFDLSSYVKNLDTPIFSYFGKVSRLKKTQMFVDAASKIKDKKFVLLFVVGDDYRAKRLKEYIVSVGLKDKCIFLPFQSPWKIPSIMKASTCIVSPESEETPFLSKGSHYPKIVREAMACGKCAIMGEGVAEKGVYTGLIKNKDVLIVNPNDIHDFKNKLEYVIDNPSIVEEIGKSAYKLSKKNEDFDKYVRGTEKVLSSTIQS